MMSWFLVGYFVGVVAGVAGALIFRGHRHRWRSWTRVWDEETSTVTDVQERTCKKCGMYEKKEPVFCPPHQWGKWEVMQLKRIDPLGRRERDYTISALKRKCGRCGLMEREDDF